MKTDEIVINYHITEKCNYSCHYCFAKYGLDDQYALEIHNDLEKVKILLKSTYCYFSKTLNIKKIRLNFAGGEPLITKNLSSIIKIAKEIGYEELSLITNASALTNNFIDKNIDYLSTLGLSIDSFDEETNIKLGRSTIANKTLNIRLINEKISYARSINKELLIKINTVVTNNNYMDLMSENISIIKPDKWKIFKVIGFRNHEGVSDDRFKFFIKNNKANTDTPIFVEDNDDMEESYIMIDPIGRFYQNTENSLDYKYSKPINEIGAEKAFSQISFNINKFNNRYISINGAK